MDMTLQRRRFLHLAAGAAALPITSRVARGEAFPSRPVRIIVAFAPGGIGDLGARLIGQSLQERLHQPVVIENRPGAGGNTGTEAVARAVPDGYTMIWAGANNAINASLYDNLSFNFVRDIAAVGSVMRGPFVVAVNPSFPATTIAEFITYAKANPAEINMASPGVGTAPHVNGELFKMMAGVEMVHVPYRGDGPALSDLIAGQVQVMFGNLISAMEHIRAGRLRALAVTTATPSPALPDVPTVAATVPGYEASAWFGLGAPRATPADVIARLNKEINASLADPKLAARLAELGGAPMPLSAEAFDAFIAAETDKWGKVVRLSGAKAN
jgi:tripartite-type tricarboxylate transporter receptor subunit TctC